MSLPGWRPSSEDYLSDPHDDGDTGVVLDVEGLLDLLGVAGPVDAHGEASPDVVGCEWVAQDAPGSWSDGDGVKDVAEISAGSG
jgi:hypothetical protein